MAEGAPGIKGLNTPLVTVALVTVVLNEQPMFLTQALASALEKATDQQPSR